MQIWETLYQEMLQVLCQNSGDTKVKSKINCYILHMFLSLIILLFIVTINCYHCIKQRSKQKKILAQ